MTGDFYCCPKTIASNKTATIQIKDPAAFVIFSILQY
jgi:hypothetical protein